MYIYLSETVHPCPNDDIYSEDYGSCYNIDIFSGPREFNYDLAYDYCQADYGLDYHLVVIESNEEQESVWQVLEILGMIQNIYNTPLLHIISGVLKCRMQCMGS